MIGYASISRPGERAVNEDAVAALEGEGGQLFVLCDGLGGHGGGEIASALAVEAASQVFLEESLPAGELLERCFAAAQEALLGEQQRSGRTEEIKTTMVLLHIQNGLARWAHVGDSRLYLFHKHKLAARTLDHSVPQMLVAQGEIKEQAIRFHEDRNRLTRVLGMAGEAPRFAKSEELAAGPPQSFLLCSDGFWEWITEKEMARLLKSSATPAAWLAAMEQALREKGAGHNMDNYSAIAVFLRDE